MKHLASTLASASLLLGAIALAAGAGAALSACRGGEVTVSGCPSSEASSPPIDPSLMAFLSAARALHHEADIKESQGDLAGAIAALERLVRTPAPRAVEVDEVLSDAHARLAELRLKKGDLEGAAQDVARGLDLARQPTYFRGHLLEVSGLVEEARAAALADAGKTEEAARAKSKAIGLLEDAVRVQEQVIREALGVDGGSNG
jgi:tetratricopeptide (TPR) repeat protein